jgi:hypothetical protein
MRFVDLDQGGAEEQVLLLTPTADQPTQTAVSNEHPPYTSLAELVIIGTGTILRVGAISPSVGAILPIPGTISRLGAISRALESWQLDVSSISPICLRPWALELECRRALAPRREGQIGGCLKSGLTTRTRAGGIAGNASEPPNCGRVAAAAP